MNADTGTIHNLLPNQTIEQFKASIPIERMLAHGFIELGNAPVADCECCKGTGVARILTSGRRIACKCTNPVV